MCSNYRCCIAHLQFSGRDSKPCAVPPSLYHSIITQSYAGFAFGAVLLAVGIVWTFIADRAGRPGVKSTFGLLRAFLVAWSENRVDMIEELIEAKAHKN